MLTRINNNSMVDTGKTNKNGLTIHKPRCVMEYNMNMGAVDQVDMQISFTECIRKTVKWYKKVFFSYDGPCYL